jgi:Domain of unknown function (DUF397)
MITSIPDLSLAVWRKSQRSANGGNCVEIASNLPGIVAVRDSKHHEGPKVTVSNHGWSLFIQGIKQGQFDL